MSTYPTRRRIGAVIQCDGCGLMVPAVLCSDSHLPGTGDTTKCATCTGGDPQCDYCAGERAAHLLKDDGDGNVICADCIAENEIRREEAASDPGRVKGDDDGVEYADPRDEQDERMRD